MGFTYEKDSDGIVTVTMDMDGQSANTMGQAYIALMEETVSKLEAEQDLAGVVFASAKKTFFAGGDLKEILAVEAVDDAYMSFLTQNKGMLRRIEALKAPAVAAINGAAMGGGFEICLACNHRIGEPKTMVGLPEVTLGLLPAAGGVIRSVALLGLEKAMPVITEGRSYKGAKALKYGLLDEMVDNVDALVPAAKAWIKANPDAHTQPWDRKGFAYPGGGVYDKNIRMMISGAPAMLTKKTRGRSPAPEIIFDIAVNSMRMGFDSALLAESRGFCKLVTSPEAKAAISTFFFAMQDIKNGVFRPEGEAWRAKSSAILGAGMMGSGIAWAHASNGLPSALKDLELASAEKGKAYSAALCDKQVKRGRMDEAKKSALLDRIRPTDKEDYEGVDIVIEAVFEDINLKEKVIPETFKMLGPDGIYGSNTSTLPISVLAEFCPDPSRFIGIHFFSPVDKMQLVELINGEKTSPETTRKAYDYCLQIGKIPIVVDDGRGFFTSRTFGTFLDEGQSLLLDGMSPAAIERAAWKIGMPVGPFAVMDEVSLTLIQKAYETHFDLDKRLGVTNGYPADTSHTRRVGYKLIDMGRGGRQYGGGFYDYAESGKRLWDGLSEFKERDLDVSMRDAEDRLLYRQCIETLRCLQEGVLNSEGEANIGSIFGIGFPAWTGGALQYVHFVGVDAFAARAAELEDRYGARFQIPAGALDILRQGSRRAA